MSRHKRTHCLHKLHTKLPPRFQSCLISHSTIGLLNRHLKSQRFHYIPGKMTKRILYILLKFNRCNFWQATSRTQCKNIVNTANIPHSTSPDQCWYSTLYNENNVYRTISLHYFYNIRTKIVQENNCTLTLHFAAYLYFVYAALQRQQRAYHRNKT